MADVLYSGQYGMQSGLITLTFLIMRFHVEGEERWVIYIDGNAVEKCWYKTEDDARKALGEVARSMKNDQYEWRSKP